MTEKSQRFNSVYMYRQSEYFPTLSLLKLQFRIAILLEPKLNANWTPYCNPVSVNSVSPIIIYLFPTSSVGKLPLESAVEATIYWSLNKSIFPLNSWKLSLFYLLELIGKSSFLTIIPIILAVRRWYFYDRKFY